MIKHFPDYNEWKDYCLSKGWTVRECLCERQVEGCFTKICRQSIAVDDDNKIRSTFKHFINSAVMYTHNI